MSEYDELDWLYDVLYASHSQTDLEDWFIEEFMNILDRKKSIIDCACGNGIQAIALARRGYKVTASDISQIMVKNTLKKAKANNIPLNVYNYSWQNLSKIGLKYDIVFCYGNSISHSSSKNDRIKNIESFKEILNPGGIIVIETRNWEKILNEKYHVYSKRSYQGNDYIPIYIWTFDKDSKKSEVVILFIEFGSQLKIYEKRLSFNYFTHKELVEEVTSLGLHVVKDTYSCDIDNYYLIISA